MKVIFTGTTNKAFDELIGKEMELNIQMQAYYTFDSEGCSFDFRHGRGRTSTIEQINYNEISRNCYDIEIKTMNSTYNFQHGEPSDEKPLTSEELRAFQMAMFL